MVIRWLEGHNIIQMELEIELRAEGYIREDRQVFGAHEHLTHSLSLEGGGEEDRGI